VRQLEEEFVIERSSSDFVGLLALPQKSLIINGAGEGNRTLVSGHAKRPSMTILSFDVAQGRLPHR
jgi:hypothetical protein